MNKISLERIRSSNTPELADTGGVAARKINSNATAIENAVNELVPTSSGATGQILTKTDDGTDWLDPSVKQVRINGITKDPINGVIDLGEVKPGTEIKIDTNFNTPTDVSVPSTKAVNTELNKTVKQVKINGEIKTPLNGLVDLGNIDGGTVSPEEIKQVVDETIQSVVTQPVELNGGGANTDYPVEKVIDFGNPEDLTTTSKQIVGAINEINAKPGGGGSVGLDTIMPETPTDTKAPSTKLFKQEVDRLGQEIGTYRIGPHNLTSSQFNTAFATSALLSAYYSAQMNSDAFSKSIKNIDCLNIIALPYLYTKGRLDWSFGNFKFLQYVGIINVEKNNWLLGSSDTITGIGQILAIDSLYYLPTNCESIDYITPNLFTKSQDLTKAQKLNSSAVDAIIVSLATVSTTQTITFYSTVKDALTQGQIAAITSKGWTIA